MCCRQKNCRHLNEVYCLKRKQQRRSYLEGKEVDRNLQVWVPYTGYTPSSKQSFGFHNHCNMTEAGINRYRRQDLGIYRDKNVFFFCKKAESYALGHCQSPARCCMFPPVGAPRPIPLGPPRGMKPPRSPPRPIPPRLIIPTGHKNNVYQLILLGYKAWYAALVLHGCRKQRFH